MLNGIFGIIILIILLYIFVKMHIRNDIYFDKIHIKVKIIGLDLEIQSKEKKHPSNQE